MKSKFNINMMFYYISFMLLLVAVASIISLFQLGGAIDIILKENLPSAIAGEKMSDELTLIHLQIVSDPETVFAEHSEDIDHLSHGFTESLVNARNNITIPGEGEIVESIEANFKKYRELVTVLKNQGSAHVSRSRLQDSYRETIGLIQRLIAINNSAIIDADENARTLAKNRSIWMIFLALIGFISGFYLIRTIKNKFSDPISDMLLSLRRVSFGDHNIRLSRQQGELGELAEHINNLLDQTKSDQTSTLNFAFEQRDLFSALGDTLNLPLFVCDLGFHIVFSNNKAKEILRKEKGEGLEQTFCNLIRSENNQQIKLNGQFFDSQIAVLRDRNHNKIGYSITLKDSEI